MPPGAAVKDVNGRTVTVSYHGKEKKIAIPEGTPVVTFAQGATYAYMRNASIYK